MTLCTKCGLPRDIIGITFDQNGVCDRCRSYEAYAHQLNDFEKLQPLFQRRLHRVRGKYEYDCLVGLSGGKDSSYVAYQLAAQHDMKLLLVTYDNGFLSDHARENIERIVKDLNQDHIFFSPSREFHKGIYRACVKKYGNLCRACTLPGFLYAIKLAFEKEIPLIIHGRSRAQMFKDLAPGSLDQFLDLLDGNFGEYDRLKNNEKIIGSIKGLIRLVNGFVNDSDLRKELHRDFVPDLARMQKYEALPEILGYFIYEAYDEEKMKKTLEEHLSWTRPPGDHCMGHEDCLVHPATSYLHNVILSYPLLQHELGTMIREGHISRHEALQMIDREKNLHTLNHESMQHIVAMTGVDSRKILRRAWKTRNRIKMLRFFIRTKRLLLGRPDASTILGPRKK